MSTGASSRGDSGSLGPYGRLCATSERIASLTVGLLLGIIVVIMLLAVWSRYVANDPIAWTEQVTRILFVWTTFLGAAVLYRRRLHIAIDFFLLRLPASLRWAVRLLNELLMLGLFIVLLVYGFELAWSTLGQTFGALDISPSTFYFAAPAAGALMIAYWIEHAAALLADRPGGGRRRAPAGSPTP